MKFKDPIEQKLNDEISIFVPSAWLNSKGFPMGEVQIWNGTLTHSDTLCLANSAARTRFIKSAVKRVAVPEAKIEEVLLLIGGNLTTRLAEDLEAERADEGRAPSQSTQLVELAADAELFHSPDGEGYATINVGSHKETWPIKAKGFRRWLMRRYYEQTKSSANAQALQDALGVLEGKALFDGQQHRVYTRIAEAQGNIYVDLANESWEAVEIAATGWRVVAESPVKFRRAKGMLALPHPVAGGSIDELRSFININEAEWPLVIECETAAFRPSGPYPVVILQGEQGSAKSTAARVLRSLVDPNVAPLRSEPRDDRDLMIAATNGWLVALDNLSHVSQSLSNGLCRLATGGGFATRELYSDSDEVLFDAMRPVLLTGIEELATQSDLADRAVILNLPVIEETERRPEKEFWRDFEEARPKILGALLDAVSTALRNVDSVRLARLPRMADFAIWATAAEPALGLKSGAFMEAYTANRRSANDLALESSLIAMAIRELAETKDRWLGTATELLNELNIKASDELKRQKVWPKTPRTLSNKLRLFAPNLRATGVNISFDREGKSRARIITLECIRKEDELESEYGCNSSSASSASSARKQGNENEEVTTDEGGRKADDDQSGGRWADDEAGVSAEAEEDANPIETKGGIDRADAADAADAKKQPYSEATTVPAGLFMRARKRLADLGYEPGQVDRMTPQQVREILSSNAAAPKRKEVGHCSNCGEPYFEPSAEPGICAGCWGRYVG